MAGKGNPKHGADLDAMLRAEHSKAQIRLAAGWVGDDRERFALVVARMAGQDRLLAQRAAWVVGDVAEAHPALVVPHLPTLLDLTERVPLHPAIHRHAVRILQFADLPPRLEGRVLAIALAAVNGTAPIAVKAYALTVLARLLERYSELRPEIDASVRSLSAEASPGLRVRLRRHFPQESEAGPPRARSRRRG